MPFINQPTTPAKSTGTPTRFDETAARKLHAALAAARMLTTQPKIVTWVEEFRLLRNYADKEQIKSALLWYIGHLRAEHVPLICSAAGFRAKFVQLQEAIARDPAAQSTHVTISPEAKQIRFDLYMPDCWPQKKPRPTPAEELLCIQRTLDNWTDYQTRLKAAYLRALLESGASGEYNDEVPRSVEGSLIYFLWSTTGLQPVDFTKGWMEDVCRIAHAWDGWQGKLKSWAWRPTNKRWVTRWSKELFDYCGQDKWAVTMREIYR